jgi:hypothetical protein
MNANEEMIRERAYGLWEHAGRPIGRSFEFWFAARAEFEVEKGAGPGQPDALVSTSVEPRRPETAADWRSREPRSRD